MPIHGVDTAATRDGVHVFHAGTRVEDGQLCTAGGRVLNVTAVGDDVEVARARAYEAADDITFDGVHRRGDIAAGI